MGSEMLALLRSQVSRKTGELARWISAVISFSSVLYQDANHVGPLERKKYWLPRGVSDDGILPYLLEDRRFYLASWLTEASTANLDEPAAPLSWYIWELYGTSPDALIFVYRMMRTTPLAGEQSSDQFSFEGYLETFPVKITSLEGLKLHLCGLLQGSTKPQHIVIRDIYHRLCMLEEELKKAQNKLGMLPSNISRGVAHSHIYQ